MERLWRAELERQQNRYSNERRVKDGVKINETAFLFNQIKQMKVANKIELRQLYEKFVASMSSKTFSFYSKWPKDLSANISIYSKPKDAYIWSILAVVQCWSVVHSWQDHLFCSLLITVAQHRLINQFSWKWWFTSLHHVYCQCVAVGNSRLKLCTLKDKM